LNLFSFKREAKVYIVYNNVQYHIDLSEVTFSQTFLEHSYSNKTVQVPNMFEQSTINKANPANFELTFPAIREKDLRILFDRALDVEAFDLYVEVDTVIFAISNCVITNTEFIIEKLRPLSISVSGEATLVSSVASVPGVEDPRSVSMTYNWARNLVIDLAGLDITDKVTTISVTLQNEVSWVSYTNVTAAIEGLAVYPDNYVIKKKILSGAIRRFETEDVTKDSDTTLFIRAGELVGSTFYGFEFDISNVTYTSNIDTGQLFTQNFTWRMIQNPDHLGEVIKYIDAGELSGAILDSWNIPVRDSSDESILESP